MMSKKEASMKILTVKDVLTALGVTRAQLYYWEETGKVPPARRTSTNGRFYLPQDVERLKRFVAQKARQGDSQ